MPTTPGPGDTIDGRYELLNEIDRGGYAVVYRTRDLNSGEEVVVKHPHYMNPDVDNPEPRFNREADILADIESQGSHENVVTLHEHFEADGIPYIVVELIEGETLEEFTQTGNPDLTRSLGIELCEALSFVHEAGYMYRDHSPDNYMLDADRTVRLIDFNNARTQIECGSVDCGFELGPEDIDRCPNCGNSVDSGTLVWAGQGGKYTPPEQVETGLPQGPWSDVYGIGNILVYLLDGTGYADDGINPQDYRIDCPDYLAEIIEKATAYEPDQRYANARQLRRALEERDPEPPVAGAKIDVLGTNDPPIEINSGDTVGRRSRSGPFPTVELETNEKWISRTHLKFINDDGTWIARDISTHGTYVRHSPNDDWTGIIDPSQTDSDEHDQEHELRDGTTLALATDQTDKTAVIRFEKGTT